MMPNKFEKIKAADLSKDTEFRTMLLELLAELIEVTRVKK